MEDKFKLDKLNIYLLVVTVIVFIILVVTIVRLAQSNKIKDTELPRLETTAGNTSTQFTTTTTEATTTTKTTTTIPTNLSSPYYSVDLNIFTEDIYKNNNVDNETAKQIVEGFIKYANALFDTNDYSVFNTDLINKVAKDGELDKIVENGIVYCELYNMLPYLDKLFNDHRPNRIYTKYNNKDIIILRNDRYYRMITDIDYNYEINSITVTKIDDKRIDASISFKLNNQNRYKRAEITLKFIDRWYIDKYEYPM